MADGLKAGLHRRSGLAVHREKRRRGGLRFVEDRKEAFAAFQGSDVVGFQGRREMQCENERSFPFDTSVHSFRRPGFHCCGEPEKVARTTASANMRHWSRVGDVSRQKPGKIVQSSG